MADIFSELAGYGLKDFTEVDIYGNKREEVDLTHVATVTTKKVLTEEDYIFEKMYSCPVCGKEFKEKTVKTGKIRVMGHDEDLRPLYDSFDFNKYDVAMCLDCGYAALAKNFSAISPTMIKEVRSEISSKFKKRENLGAVYTYDDAIEHYKMALVNCIVKHSKASERAYLCLKIAWLYRGKAEVLPDCTANYDEVIRECKEYDDAFSKKAYEGFVASLAKEVFPICGMDEYTLSYIMAVLARKCGEYNNARRLLGRVILSHGVKETLKEMAREQKRILDEVQNENEVEEV